MFLTNLDIFGHATLYNTAFLMTVIQFNYTTTSKTQRKRISWNDFGQES